MICRYVSTTALVLAIGAGPAAAQRSLFDQPLPAAPAAPVAPPTAPSPPATAPVAPSAPPVAAPAQAEAPAPRRPVKPSPRKARGPVPARSLAILNATPQALAGLEVTQGGRSAKLRKPLAAGKRTTLALPSFKACEVSVVSTFEGSAPGEPSTVDICQEKSINFRD